MGKKTINEYISKIIFDRRIDPADIELLILDSGEVRCIPFNFVKFEMDGFHYKGNFYPQYKILAVYDKLNKKYLLKRSLPKLKILGHKVLDFGDFAYDLTGFYDDFTILRHLPWILNFIEEKIIKKGDYSWFEKLGPTKKIYNEDITVTVINGGLFKNIAALFVGEKFFNIIRLKPKVYDAKILNGHLQFQRIIVPKSNVAFNSIETCFFGRRFICVNSKLELFDPSASKLTRRQQLELMGFFIHYSVDDEKVLMIGSIEDKKYLTPKMEKMVLEKIKLESLFDLDNFYVSRDIVWLKNEYNYNLFRLSDYDQILVGYNLSY